MTAELAPIVEGKPDVSKIAQIDKLVEQFIRANKITIIPELFYQDSLKRRLIITLNMSRGFSIYGPRSALTTQKVWNPFSTALSRSRSTADGKLSAGYLTSP